MPQFKVLFVFATVAVTGWIFRPFWPVGPRKRSASQQSGCVLVRDGATGCENQGPNGQKDKSRNLLRVAALATSVDVTGAP